MLLLTILQDCNNLLRVLLPQPSNPSWTLTGERIGISLLIRFSWNIEEIKKITSQVKHITLQYPDLSCVNSSLPKLTLQKKLSVTFQSHLYLLSQWSWCSWDVPMKMGLKVLSVFFVVATGLSFRQNVCHHDESDTLCTPHSARYGLSFLRNMRFYKYSSALHMLLVTNWTENI